MRFLLAVSSLLVALVAPVPVPTAAAAPAPPCSADDPFGAELAAEIDQRYAGHRVTAAVLDVATGCAYAFRPGERVTTASVLKVEIYVGILLRAQREGRWLTASEAAAVWPMITESANPPASRFFAELGGVPGIDALSRSLGMDDTHAASTWGLTVSSAQDQVDLLHQVLLGTGGPLEAPYREALADAMRSVVPTQRWGVSAGVPPGWTVALKNGFASSRCCGWRTNSVGAVSGPGGSYVVAILTDGWSTQAEGVAAVELLSRAVAARLARVPYLEFRTPAAFVERVHADVTGAPPSLPALLWLTGAAGFDGSAAGSLVDGLLGLDASGRGDLVASLYRGLLGRPVDAEALEHWKGVVRGGGPTALTGALLATPELQAATSGLDDAGFVRWAYDGLLGRAVDGPGGAYWTAEVGRLGRAAVVAGLASTAEARARLGHEAAVVQAYDALLHRLPSGAEVESWHGHSRAAVAAAVVGSPEYVR